MLIRISFRDGKQIDWIVESPENVTFSDFLDAIYQASDDQLIVSAFEYADEEEDIITVKNQGDLDSMIEFYRSQDEERITIRPKLCKNPGNRNKFGLKLEIAPSKRLIAQNAVSSTQQSTSNSSKLQTQSSATAAQQNYQQQYRIPESDIEGVNENKKDLHEMDGLSSRALSYVETLGNGNSGIVYKVIHKASRIVMAVKSIGIDLTGEEQNRIKSELEILSQCNSSPQIIDFYGAFSHENKIFLCTEFMDGGSLDRFGKIPEVVLKRIAHRVVSGLKFLWGRKIMHRDVKPSNMLVNSNGQVKLCDFGVSRQLVNSIAKTYIGTNAYMAPERVEGFDYTFYSDIWSLGLSICEMATGEYPYPELAMKIRSSGGVVPMEILQCIVNAAPPQLPTDKFSSQIVDFVNGCLQKEAKSRPSPDVLSQHSFLQISQILDHEDQVIANWVEQNKAKSK
uniref:dual specificity mitogen-activated protein kinase kinase 5-like n=1 Tax=Styela clava TaxID=7725 RepID=UPI00193A8526|nr:dual specificity mitogen-activated protein kinase kinase 5-like [Styela clava]